MLGFWRPWYFGYDKLCCWTICDAHSYYDSHYVIPRINTMIVTIFITFVLTINAIVAILDIFEYRAETGFAYRVTTMIDTIAIVALGIWLYALLWSTLSVSIKLLSFATYYDAYYLFPGNYHELFTMILAITFVVLLFLLWNWALVMFLGSRMIDELTTAQTVAYRYSIVMAAVGTLCFVLWLRNG